MESITIKDIARELNYSVSTVSKALNNSKEISEETRKRITEYAEAYNYKPNRMAQSLKSRRMYSIGVVVSSFYNSTFWAEILDGIHTAAMETGYDILVMQNRENIENEKTCLELLLNKGVDGILLAQVTEDSNLAYITSINKRQCPVVLFDRINPKINTTQVGVNEYRGAYEATLLLLQKNRKKIAFITGDNYGDNHPRYLGFTDALREFKTEHNPKLLIQCNVADKAAMDSKIKEAITCFKNNGNLPDAIFGATDALSMRTLGVLAELDIKVPKEIAVIGFSNTDIAGSLNPPLSTIYQPAREMGYTATAKLGELINLRLKNEKVENFETILLDTSLQLRKSTDV